MIAQQALWYSFAEARLCSSLVVCRVEDWVRFASYVGDEGSVNLSIAEEGFWLVVARIQGCRVRRPESRLVCCASLEL